MEVADVFVINKADRPGVDGTRRDLEQMLELSAETASGPGDGDGWRLPIVATVASGGEGVAELWDAVEAHRAFATRSGLLDRRRRHRAGEELREIIARRLEERARDLCTGDRWDALTERVLARDVDPWAAADQMLAPVEA
jgi:LAO/AO transport system kinase